MERSNISSKFAPELHNMLNILHELQNDNPQNYLSSEDLKWVANYLNTTYSSVYGVAKYYSMFSLTPRGKYIIRVCKSPLCKMIDGEHIIKCIKEKLKIGIGDTTNDSLFTLETSECLGHCAQAPVMMINDKVYKNLNAQKIDKILKSIIK